MLNYGLIFGMIGTETFGFKKMAISSEILGHRLIVDHSAWKKMTWPAGVFWIISARVF
jgi:hypothetical protein